MKKAQLKKEEERMRVKQQEELKHLRELKELRKKRDLQNSCQPSKVRTYACNEDGYRIIKYFDYKFDFDEDMCVEKVKKRTVKCTASESRDDWEDEKRDRRSHDRKRRHKRRRDDDDEYS